MDYLQLKHFHMACVALSGALFLLRGAWMLADSPLLQRRWVKTLPHVVDALLLASAIGLAAWSHQYPGQAPWVTAKVCALFIYILLGTIALKRGKTRRARALALAGAVLAFAYIVAVAITKSPFVFVAA